MLSDITIGQFFPGSSVVHRLDPRVKIVLIMAILVTVFVASTPESLALVAAFTVIVMALTAVPLKMYFKSVKPIIPIVIFTALLNIIYSGGDDVLFSFLIFSVTLSGIKTAVFMAVRIVCLIFISSVLTYTTSPTDLTDAIERLLSPLKVFRLDIHSLAMMMTIALRFIPTLIEEAEKIMNAQKSRGADMSSGNIMARAKAMLPVLVPLFVSSFRRAYELAYAMECRCYNGGEGRTRMKVLHLGIKDIAAVFVYLLLLCAVVALNFMFAS